MIILLITICSALSMVLAIALCSCWKREQQKNHWLGLDGMVTQKNPDENVNHLPGVTALYTAASENNAATVNDDANNSSLAAVTKTRRSLPDIPSEPNRTENPLWTEPSGDNNSELYATVEQYNMSKRHTIPNGIDARPSISQHSSISQADGPFSPYARVNYDKVKKENPYASVQNSANNNEQDENSSDEAVLLRPSTSQAHDDPVAPPRSRRTSDHSGVGIDIQAAPAVAGDIAANVELPYMTPPINQPNFSGDSQDSSKGYTSISVREPLEKIRAQTKEIKKLRRDLDPHYSSVSDESDEMYTTIQEPNNELYMSTSETYAQIAPLPLTVNAEINPVPSTSAAPAEITDQVAEPAPHPPTVDSLKHVTAHTHSRQASSSSSVGLLGSPKPEKRQANSPLPPPPSNSPDSQRSPIVKNLDDMYAKVHKNRKTMPPAESEDMTDRVTSTARRKLSLNAEAEDKIFYEDETSSGGKKSPAEKKFRRAEHNYETLRNDDPDPDYEKLKGESEPGYASINGPDSLISSDPGYEVLKQSDPNYESLRRRTDSAGYSDLMAGYSVINKKKKLEVRNEEDVGDEPNYESMPNYVKSTDSESDPNYESVKYLDIDPPYEKLSNEDKTEGIDSSSGSNGTKEGSADLPYERLPDDSKTDSESSSYERIKYSDNQVPGYETIRPKRTDEEDPTYDTVIHATNDEEKDKKKDSQNNSDEDIFEV